MTILGSGEVGVGFTTPTYRLDVKDNINLRPGAFGDGYRWWDGSTGVTILHTNAVATNIFLGNGSGAAHTAGGANTFLGVNAGSAQFSNGGGNTFTGWNAGGSGTTSCNRANISIKEQSVMYYSSAYFHLVMISRWIES